MAIVGTVEQSKQRGGSGKIKDGCEWTRTYLVRVDDPTTSLVDISNAPGVAFGDSHPDDSSTVMQTFDVKVADSVGLMYAVTFKYTKFVPTDTPSGGEQGMVSWPPIWSGNSSVTTGPVRPNANGDLLDNNGIPIQNSAGDPLEGLEMEYAEERLTLTGYVADHTQWTDIARQYTNAINSDTWNGGAPLTWKCQGCSKKLKIENVEQTTVVFWEVTWEFAYRADKWTLKPWDIGFNRLVDPDGNPVSIGAPSKNRQAIKGQDGKPVRQPVALDGAGQPRAIGQPPIALEFHVYDELPFGNIFGQVYTPTPPSP